MRDRIAALPRRWLRIAAILAATTWILALFLVVVPTVGKALSGHGELSRIEERVSRLDGWTGARFILERDLVRHGDAVAADWRRFFPPRKDRERLFLELARVADESGVTEFDLAEVTNLDQDPAALMGQEDDDFFDPMAETAPEPEVGTARRPGVTLASYTVRARWLGDYERSARFLGGLRGVHRALAVKSLALQPHRDGVRVEMEMEVFGDGGDES